MLLKDQIAVPARPLRSQRPAQNENVPSDDEAWINDVGPWTEPHIATEGETEVAVVSSPKNSQISGQPHTPISKGHVLWSVLLRLSERIWHDLYQKAEVVLLNEPILIEWVQKRTLELLRGEPTFANQVQDSQQAELLLQGVVDEVLRCGPLELLLKDTNVSEIMSIGPRRIYVERNGNIEEASRSFEDERHMMRKRSPEPLTLADLVECGSMSQDMSDFLAACIQARLNIVICGQPDAGRTTLLNVLSTVISEGNALSQLKKRRNCNCARGK